MVRGPLYLCICRKECGVGVGVAGMGPTSRVRRGGGLDYHLSLRLSRFPPGQQWVLNGESCDESEGSSPGSLPRLQTVSALLSLGSEGVSARPMGGGRWPPSIASFYPFPGRRDKASWVCSWVCCPEAVFQPPSCCVRFVPWSERL